VLSLTAEERRQLWAELVQAIEEYIGTVKSHRVAPAVDVETLRNQIAGIDFVRPMAPRGALRWITGLLWNNQVHTAHPRYYGLWMHADAAWGGAAALVPELAPCIDGIQRADSITFDAHKFLSVPMGAGMFFTRHPRLPERVFAITTDYMPLTHDQPIVEPHRTTMQWSRRFIGLKLFLSLAVAGWDGYADVIRHQTAMGDLLREKLVEDGWKVVNRTPLPTVCFVDGGQALDNTAESLGAIADAVVEPGKAWISATKIGGTVPVLRACITNFNTQPDDIDALVRDLGRARLEAEK
jgi:glutamate/tyrosine decarboxylase-like PLP-dependent enzyme